MSLAPAAADYVALADQDDRWDPDKLEVLLREIGDAQLAFSDARIVDAGGELLAGTYWQERRNNHTDIASVLMANSVTGAASLFRHDLLDYALPFPPGQFHHFHDHWLGLTALARGEVQFVEPPAVRLRPARRRGAWPRRRQPHDAAWATASGAGGVRCEVVCGCGDSPTSWMPAACSSSRPSCSCAAVTRSRPASDARLSASYARTARFCRSAWLLTRSLRELVGTPETLGAELGLFFGFGWRHAAGAEPRAAPSRRDACGSTRAPRRDWRKSRAAAGPTRSLCGRSTRSSRHSTSPPATTRPSGSTS